MIRIVGDTGQQFATELLEDIKTNKILKDCMVNHSDAFTEDVEELHQRRFCAYLGSCGCYLMDLRIEGNEVGYHG